LRARRPHAPAGAPVPAPVLKLRRSKKRQLSNAGAVWIVELHEFPFAQVNLVVLGPGAPGGVGGNIPGQLSLTTATAHRGRWRSGRRSNWPTRQISDLGAELSASSGFDSSAVRCCTSRIAALVRRAGPSWPMCVAAHVSAGELERIRRERLSLHPLQARETRRIESRPAFSRVLYARDHRTGSAGGRARPESLPARSTATTCARSTRPPFQPKKRDSAQSYGDHHARNSDAMIAARNELRVGEEKLRDRDGR